MQLWQMIAIGAAAVILIVATVWVIYQRNRTRQMQEDRIQRVKLRPLNPADEARFLGQWRLCQARFVDDPPGALKDADRLVTEVMRTRGFRVDDPRDRFADVCAAYPQHAQSYLEANEIVARHGRGYASVEDLREAFLNIRSLFDEIVEMPHQELKRAS
jgi:hypothetical protein